MVNPQNHFKKEKSFFFGSSIFIILVIAAMVLSFLNNDLMTGLLLCLLPLYFVHKVTTQAISVSLKNDCAEIKSLTKTRCISYNEINSIELLTKDINKVLDSVVVLSLTNNMKISLSGFEPGGESLFKSLRYYHDKKTKIPELSQITP